MNQPARAVPPLRRTRTYQPGMRGWWRRARAPYRRYLLRELTSVAVVYVALLIVVALQRLLAGPAAFDAFVAALRSPLWAAVNLLAVAAVGFHAVTWFQVMPKTMPLAHVRGRRVPDAAVVAGGLAAFALASAAVFMAFWMGKP